MDKSINVSNSFELQVRSTCLLKYFAKKLNWQLSQDEYGFTMPLPVSRFINQDFLNVMDQFKNDYNNDYFYLDEIDEKHVNPSKHFKINKAVLNDAYQVYQSLSRVDLSSFDTFKLIKLI